MPPEKNMKVETAKIGDAVGAATPGCVNPNEASSYICPVSIGDDCTLLGDEINLSDEEVENLFESVAGTEFVFIEAPAAVESTPPAVARPVEKKKPPAKRATSPKHTAGGVKCKRYGANSAKKGYLCGKCGLPKKGHVCPFDVSLSKQSLYRKILDTHLLSFVRGRRHCKMSMKKKLMGMDQSERLRPDQILHLLEL